MHEKREKVEEDIIFFRCLNCEAKLHTDSFLAGAPVACPICLGNQKVPFQSEKDVPEIEIKTSRKR